MRMRRWFGVGLVIAATAASLLTGGRTVAQGGCATTPLTPKQAAAIYLKYFPAGTVVPQPAERGVSVDDYLALPRADEATAKAVADAFGGILACYKEYGFLGLMTNSTQECAALCFYPDVGQPAPSEDDLIAFLSSPELGAPPADKQPSLDAILDARKLADGRIGLLMVTTDPTTATDSWDGTTLDIWLFAQEKGAWKFDGEMEDPFGLAPASSDEGDGSPEATPEA